MMRFLQKLGKALFLPVAIMPICGIMLGLGYAIAPAILLSPEAVAQGSYPTSGMLYVLGYFLVKAGSVLMSNTPLLFAIGVAVGLADDNDGTAALAGLVAWIMIRTILSTEVVSHIAPEMFVWTQSTECAVCGSPITSPVPVPADSITKIAFDNINNSFIGILCGIIGACCYNRFRHIQLPDYLAFFSGKRSVALATGLVSMVVAAVLLFVWPVVFSGLVTLGNGIKKTGIFGVGIYAFLNRLLIPTGLHHALNNVFWFDTIGLGDLSAYWGGQVMGDIHKVTGAPISWSVGMYMSGFFPCMMFGVPGAALAMIRTAKSSRRKAIAGVLGSTAVCAFLSGITEPFEFAFMFLSFPLYIVYALLYAIFAVITVAVGYRAGFCFSAGLTDAVFSSFLPAARNTWMLLPLGAAAFLVFYLVFYFAIKKWDLKTPGREDEQEDKMNVQMTHEDYVNMAAAILEGVGGKDNLTSVEHCITRLRLEIRNRMLIDEKKIRDAGVAGIVRPGKYSIQIVIGPKVQFVYEEFKKLTEN